MHTHARTCTHTHTYVRALTYAHTCTLTQTRAHGTHVHLHGMQLSDVEVLSLRISLAESQEYSRRLQRAAQEVVVGMGELRGLLDGVCRHQQQGVAAGPSEPLLWSPATASHLSALLASFDACARRFRAIAAAPPPPPHAPPHSGSGAGAAPAAATISPSSPSNSPAQPPASRAEPLTHLPYASRSAPQVLAIPPSAVVTAAALGAPLSGRGPGSSGANSVRHPPANQRKPKAVAGQQQHGSGGEPLSPLQGLAASGGSNHTLRRQHSLGEELLADGPDVQSGAAGGGKGNSNRGGSNQLSTRVGRLQVRARVPLCSLACSGGL